MATTVSPQRLTDLLRSGPWTGPIYRDLAERLRALIIDGQLSHGDRLPGERALALNLAVSRTTVTSAYEHLRRSGLLESVRGAGSTVHLPFGHSVASALVEAPAGMVTMTHAAPPAPAGLGAVYERALTSVPSLLSTPGYLPDGLPVLTERLADRLSAQGLPTSPEQLLITSGAQSALRTVARWALRRGDRVLVEGLVYPHLIDVLRDAGARTSALPHGATPWDLDAVASRLRGDTHRAAFLTVDFHNPTGALLSGPDRETLAALLRRHRVRTVVDETVREVVLDDTVMPPSFAHYDSSAIVVGSAAKSVWGGLRIGWIRTPLEHRQGLIQARMAHDLGAAPFEQLVYAEVLADPDDILAAGRAVLRRNRDALTTAMAEHLPQFEVAPSHGGLSIWAQLPGPVSTQLCRAAASHGVALTPGPRFAVASGQRSERHLRLPYGQSPEVLRDAVSRISAAWDDLAAADPSGSAPPAQLVV
ncbi:MAG: PLP-dependent aminotransferase family protein [Mycetocola sp.]